MWWIRERLFSWLHIKVFTVLNTKEPHVYLSFSGAKSNCHFTFEDLKSLGYHVCDTLLDFCDPDRSKVRVSSCSLTELEDTVGLARAFK